MIVRNAEVEEGAGIAFYLDAAFVELFGTLDVTFLELLGALLKALHGLDFCGVGGRGMWSGGGSPSLEETIVYQRKQQAVTENTHVSGHAHTGQKCDNATRRGRWA